MWASLQAVPLWRWACWLVQDDAQDDGVERGAPGCGGWWLAGRSICALRRPLLQLAAGGGSPQQSCTVAAAAACSISVAFFNRRQATFVCAVQRGVLASVCGGGACAAAVTQPSDKPLARQRGTLVGSADTSSLVRLRQRSCSLQSHPSSFRATKPWTKKTFQECRQTGGAE